MNSNFKNMNSNFQSNTSIMGCGTPEKLRCGCWLHSARPKKLRCDWRLDAPRQRNYTLRLLVACCTPEKLYVVVIGCRVPKMKSQGDKPWPTFRQGSNDFVSISAEPKTESNFRYCQMALWASLSDPLQSLKCQSVGGLESLGGVLGEFSDSTIILQIFRIFDNVSYKLLS